MMKDSNRHNLFARAARARPTLCGSGPAGARVREPLTFSFTFCAELATTDRQTPIYRGIIDGEKFAHAGTVIFAGSRSGESALETVSSPETSN